MNAPGFAMFTAWALENTLKPAMPKIVLSVGVRVDSNLVVMTKIAPKNSTSSEAIKHGQSVAFNLMIYSFSIPLFSALAVASEGSTTQHLWRLFSGNALLLLFVYICAWVRFLYIAQFGAHFQHAHVLPDSPLITHSLKYAHYLTSTILPTALPVLLWTMLYRDTFLELIAGTKSFSNCE
jgi:hypothetical protein